MDEAFNGSHRKNRGVIRGEIARMLLKKFSPKDAIASPSALFPEAEILKNLTTHFGTEFLETVNSHSQTRRKIRLRAGN
jgi:hypothetical protein